MFFFFNLAALGLSCSTQDLGCVMREIFQASLVVLQLRNHLQCRRCGFDPWVRKIPWRGKWQPNPVSLPGESHGQRSLEGYTPWAHKELEMIEAS